MQLQIFKIICVLSLVSIIHSQEDNNNYTSHNNKNIVSYVYDGGSSRLKLTESKPMKIFLNSNETLIATALINVNPSTVTGNCICMCKITIHIWYVYGQTTRSKTTMFMYSLSYLFYEYISNLFKASMYCNSVSTISHLTLNFHIEHKWFFIHYSFVLNLLFSHKPNKTGVINDPLGQTHSHASSEQCFLLICFSRFEKWGRTDNMCEYNDPYRPWLWVGRVDQKFQNKYML